MKAILITVLLALSVDSRADIVVPVAYRNVGQVYGIPYKYLFAIAMQESKRKLPNGSVLPWPWTLNVAGDSKFYNTSEAMWVDLVALVGQGRTNIDIGLMQINYKWHHKRANSLLDLTRPEVNLNIAAQILVGEHKRCEGDWWCAVGGYHSYREALANNYIKSVRRWYDLLI